MNKVLIVEDHADIRRLIRMTLEFEECEILEASSGETGLALAASELPDLVLLDVMMPGTMDGLEVCRRLKAAPGLAHIRVVMLSACGTAADVQKGTEAGADAYVVKPFSPLLLTSLVEGFVRTSGAAA